MYDVFRREHHCLSVCVHGQNVSETMNRESVRSDPETDICFNLLKLEHMHNVSWCCTTKRNIHYFTSFGHFTKEKVWFIVIMIYGVVR